jgi:hypothetical protein
MKRILAILFLLPIAFVSCGEDEDNFVQQNYLVGTWEINETGARSPQGVIIYQPYVNNTDCKDNYIFNADFTFQNNDYNTEGTCVSNAINGTYSRLSTNVTLNYTIQGSGGAPQQVQQTLTVISLTFTEVILAYTNDVNQIVYLKCTKV